MPTPKELFKSLDEGNVFNTLDFQYGYHQLPLEMEDWMKIAFWGVGNNGKDSLYLLKFLSLGLKNALSWISTCDGLSP
jgi:hypothetical protein